MNKSGLHRRVLGTSNGLLPFLTISTALSPLTSRPHWHFHTLNRHGFLSSTTPKLPRVSGAILLAHYCFCHACMALHAMLEHSNIYRPWGQDDLWFDFPEATEVALHHTSSSRRCMGEVLWIHYGYMNNLKKNPNCSPSGFTRTTGRILIGTAAMR